MSNGNDDCLDWDDEGLDLGIFVSSTLIKAGIQGLTLQIKAVTLYKNKLINYDFNECARSYNPIRLN